MSKIQELLFSNLENFDVDEILNYPFTISCLLSKEKKKDADKIQNNFDTHILLENSKKCEPFRKSAAVKRNEQAKRAETLKDWFGFQKTELSKEDEADIEILRHRKIIDPKKGLKNADNLNNGYVKVGTIVDDPIHGQGGRLKNKDRKNRVYEQFIDEDKSIGHTKKKFQEIQTQKMNNSRNKKWVKLKRIRMAKKTLNDDVREMKF